MPPRGGGAAAEAGGADDDDQHHLIERSEEGRSRREHLSNHDREAEALWQQQVNRFGEGSFVRRALKVMMAGTLLLLLLSLVHENWSKTDRNGDNDGRGVAFTQEQRDATAAATAAALAAAAAKEEDLKKQMAKQHEAEAEVFAAKKDLEILGKAEADAEAAAVAAGVKKVAEEEEAAAVAAAVAAAKKKKEEEEEEKKKVKATTTAAAATKKEEKAPMADQGEAAAVAAAVTEAKKKKKEEEKNGTAAAAVAALDEDEGQEEELKDLLAEEEDDDDVDEEDEEEEEEEEELAAQEKAEPTTITTTTSTNTKKPAKAKDPTESTTPLKPSTSRNSSSSTTTTATNIPAIDLSTLDAPKELTKLTAARALVASALASLAREHTPEHAQTLFASLHYHNRDYIKHKLIRALLGQNNSPGKADSGHDFIMSFAGTSVTAGHDNFFQQSYPVVLQKLLLEAYTTAGLHLEIRNHAMGNNPPIPAAFCVKSQLGEDTDLAAWEFGMMVNGPLANANIEEWMRNALYLPKRPALLMVDPGEGARKPDREGVLPTTPRKGPASPWGIGGDEGSLLEYYAEYGVHTQAMYEAVWTLDHLPQYNFKALVQDNKPTPKPASWHPGPGGHLLRAQILGHHYLTLLDDAMVDVQAALEADNAAGSEGVAATTSQVQALLASTTEPAAAVAADKASTNKKKKKKEKMELPPPLYCDPLFCAAAASCAMTFEPKQQDSLLDLVISPEGLPKAKPTIDPQDSKKWHVQLFEADHEGVQFSQAQGFKYLDMKYVLQGNKDAGPLTLAVETQSKQHLLFCQPPGVWGRMPENCGDIRTDAAFTIDEVPMGLETATNFYFRHTIESPTCWASKEMVEAGPHVIKVIPTNAEGKYIVLSALIWY